LCSDILPRAPLGLAGAAHSSGHGFIEAPTGIVGDGKGNLYIAEGGNRRISRIDGKGNINPLTVTSGTPLNDPQTLVIDSAGRLIVFDSGANQVFRLNPL
jgi:streptogramin lyase